MMLGGSYLRFYGLIPEARVNTVINGWHYLEDHPMTCKWLITMVRVTKSPNWGCEPLPNGRFMAYTWG